MAEEQLWLFAQSKPLRERLGAEFFKGVPTRPGVYIMTGRNERVLYVGQSGNLRHRLNTYKNVCAGKDPAKLVRLVQAVERITWETSADAQAARLRENELLRLFRPKFNTVNTHPEAYGFVGLHVKGDQLDLWLTQDTTGGGELYGAFKGIRLAGYASLLRLLLRALSGLGRPEQFPCRILGAKPPKRWTVPLRTPLAERPVAFWVESLRLYLDGSSCSILEGLREILGDGGGYGSFWQNLHLQDLETAEAFFQRGPKRNRDLKNANGLEERLLAPAQLDDLIVLQRKAREELSPIPEPRAQTELGG